MDNIKEFQDHDHTISKERSPDGKTNNEIDSIMTDKSITLNTIAERRKLLNKNTRKRVDTQIIGTKKNTFQLELKNRFTALE